MKKAIFLLVIFSLMINLLITGVGWMNNDDRAENPLYSVANAAEEEPVVDEKPDVDVDVEINDDSGEGLFGGNWLYVIIGAVLILVVIVAIVSMTNSKRR